MRRKYFLDDIISMRRCFIVMYDSAPALAFAKSNELSSQIYIILVDRPSILLDKM